MILDNYDLWAMREAEQEKQLARLPKCSCCGEPIQDLYCYEINDELICEDCLEQYYKKNTEYFYD